MFNWETTIDDSGYLWLVANWKHVPYAIRIAPNGEKSLDKVQLAQYGKPIQVITDRWENAYCTYFIEEEHNIDHTFIGRISATGSVQEYSSWLNELGDFKAFLSIMPADTLWISGEVTASKDYLVAKGLMTQDGLTPLSKNSYSRNYALHRFMPDMPYDIVLLDWAKAISLRLGATPKELNIERLLIKENEGFGIIGLGTFKWHDYIWRSYPDVWIGSITYSPYKDGGYVLCISDNSRDSTGTYLIRIGDDGIPIDPSTLKDGGKRYARAFTSLPRDARPNVRLFQWNKNNGLEPDSAMVVFWGCDNEGNLYAYSKTKKF